MREMAQVDRRFFVPLKNDVKNGPFTELADSSVKCRITSIAVLMPGMSGSLKKGTKEE